MLLVFHNGMQEKRRFIDRLINISNPTHVGLLYRYEFLIKERLKIINNYNDNKIWIDTIENDIVNLSINIIENSIGRAAMKAVGRRGWIACSLVPTC